MGLDGLDSRIPRVGVGDAVDIMIVIGAIDDDVGGAGHWAAAGR